LRWQADSTPKNEHIGHAQLQELLTHIEEDAARWLVVGDFNATSDSEVLRGAYARGWEESCRSLRPWDTTNINGRCRKLDYLLYRTGQLIPEPMPLPRLERTTPMPSKEHPSDHLPVSVRYQTPKATRAPRRTATPNTESGTK
jgi:endonuclease/exonuclease/phosphatase (EEP) superfamily protein YafD